MADPQAFRHIFRHLPEVYFFVKAADGRMIAASPSILSRLGFRSEAEFIGKTDYEVFPRHLADAYTADDAIVIRTRRPLVDRLEIWYDENRRLDWCVTTKVPLEGRDGTVIGLMGITRRDQQRSGLLPATDASRAVDYLRTHASRAVPTAELARHLGLSLRTLHRKVQEAFGIPPYELALRVRIQKAAEALLLAPRTDIAHTALTHGFCDQSAFTHHFRKRMGTTPRQFQLRHSGTS